jgi:mRNA-degrading endonuclease RelE of RelBE toxin-antitoxin system
MTKYEVEFTESSQKELNKLPNNVSNKVLKAIDFLTNNPRAGSVRPMVGISSWRLRVGD